MTKNAPKALKMLFRKGQMLSLISIAPKRGSIAADVREAYSQRTFGLAREFGVKPAGGLPVTAVGAGSFS